MQHLLLFSQSPRTELVQVSVEIVKEFGDCMWLWIILHVRCVVNFFNHTQIRLDQRVQLL